MLTTGQEDSSPRWEQHNIEQDVAAEDRGLVSAPMDLVLDVPPPGPHRAPAWRQVRFWTIVQVILAALILSGVSLAAFAVAKGPRMPGAVVVGPSIVITTVPASRTGTVTSSTATPRATPIPPVPAGTIKFGGGGDTSVTQHCNGTQPLAALAIFLDNGHSNVPVDWWVNVAQATPDGKLPWAVANLPYGTLPAGKSTSVTLTPAVSLCTLLAGGAVPVTFTADIDYGGVGGFRITDMVVPGAGPTPTDTATANATP